MSFGWDAVLHADEFSDAGAARMAVELASQFKSKIRSLDHGQFISDDLLPKMVEEDIALVLLPLTSFFEYSLS